MGKPGKHYKKIAEKNGLKTRNGKGDHVVVEGPAGRGYMTIPMHKELDKGTESAIKKWFKALGIICGLLLLPPTVCFITGLLMKGV